jgi:nitroimidazol reductase NimA-like FMN-containing flavoprotein (pyridoxamine 5'-phosphate oxidase superfamily)
MQKPSTHRRREIQLTPDEQHALLHIAPKAALATLDQDGFPHVVAMSYLAKDGAIYMTSYAKAQKVLNIRRNPRVGVLIETGERYTDYRGVMVRGYCEIIEDPPQVETIIQEIGAKNRDTGHPQGDAGENRQLGSHQARREILIETAATEKSPLTLLW